MAKTNEKSLTTRSMINTAMVNLLMGVALFASAGTLRYWQGWVYLGWQAFSMTATNVYLIRRDPELLRRRLAQDEQGEMQGVHKAFAVLVRLSALVILVVSGLDHRFGWTAVPASVAVAGNVVVAAGVLVIFLVFRENSFASSVVEVDARQTVVSSGPYRFVRHPMYAGVLLGTAATPLALGSFGAEVFLPFVCVLFAVRMLAEERFLADKLPGYSAYMTKTRSRIVPWVW